MTSSEEWIETPAPYLRYLVSTHARCYNVLTGHYLEQVTMPHKAGARRAVPAFRLQVGATRARGSNRVYIPVGSLIWRSFVGPVGAGRMVVQRDPDGPWWLENLILRDTARHLRPELVSV